MVRSRIRRYAYKMAEGVALLLYNPRVMRMLSLRGEGAVGPAVPDLAATVP